MSSHSSLSSRLYGSEVPLQERLYNIIFTFGVIMGATGAVTCVTIHSSVQASVLAAAMTVLVFGMWLFGYKLSNRRKTLVIIMMAVLDFLVLPALYLSGGSIHSGISAYFALAIALTYVIVKGRAGKIVIAIQCAFYLFLYWFSYRYSAKLVTFPALLQKGLWFEHVAVGSNVIMVALALGVLGRVVFSVLRQENHNLEESIIDMTRLAELDSLTGLYNRRALYKHATEEVRHATRYHSPLSILFIDIDNFKSINDQYGHLTGDEVLRNLSTYLQSCCTGRMSASRYGGEEFVLLMPGSSLEQASQLAETVCTETADRKLADTIPNPVTVSIGVAEYTPEETAEGFVRRADQKMYQAKASGKNQACS